MADEQWKAGGDCRNCRRRNYCRKRCSANKRLMEAFIRGAIRGTKVGKMMEAAREEMEKNGGGPYSR